MNLIIEMLRELERVGESIDAGRVDALCEGILSAPRVYVAGRGRSGLIARMFAMRLMHMGLTAYAVDEVVTPAIAKGDLLLLCSGSGETGSLKTMCDRALQFGASVQLITANECSYIAQRAAQSVLIQGYTPKNETNVNRSIQPMGSQFEQLLMMTLDACVIKIMQARGVTEAEMMARHANLE